METHVLITFTNLSLSTGDTSAPLPMELSYESKKIKFNYPQTEPLKLSLSPKFIQDKVSLILSTTIDSSHNKKNKIQFRSDIPINKTIFSENNKTIYEKSITMIPIEPIKEIKEMKEKKVGKIFMQIQLLDSIEEWKKNFKNLNKKKTGTKLKSNSSNNDSISNPKNLNKNNSNKNYNKQTSGKKTKKEEMTSETKVESIYDDENEDNKAMDELNKLISLEHINQLKELMKNDYKKIFSNDISTLKALNENLYQKYNQLSIKYNEILQDLNNSNENIRKKACQYYKEYKELKSKLEQKKNEFKKNQKNIEEQISKNKQETDSIKNNLQKYYNEKDFFMKKLESHPSKEKKENKENTENKNNEQMQINYSGINNAEIKMLRDALKKISSLGYDLTDGLNITDEEKQALNNILNDNAENNKENENNEEIKKDLEEGQDDNEVDKEDYDLSNQIVGLIERDVNDLYMRKLIEQVKIDQIDAITYSFKGNTKTKDVEFKIENGNLVCNTGESFTVWLISNFSL